MKKTVFILLISLILLSGCNHTPAIDLSEEGIATFPIVDEKDLAKSVDSPMTAPEMISKFNAIGFENVAGQYSRNVVQDDATITEIFAIEKNNFVRIASSDMEQEVFAYNYQSDDFTYLYYFDGDLMTKTKFNVDTGMILEDEAGYADLLQNDSSALKTYFLSLISQAGLSLDDITLS